MRDRGLSFAKIKAQKGRPTEKFSTQKLWHPGGRDAEGQERGEEGEEGRCLVWPWTIRAKRCDKDLRASLRSR